MEQKYKIYPRSKVEKDAKALKAVKEASISIACLTNFWEYFEDENNDLKNPKWVLKEEKLLERDIYHIQDQITILENFLDPFTVEELENQEVEK